MHLRLGNLDIPCCTLTEFMTGTILDRPTEGRHGNHGADGFENALPRL
jgi:hypothetical protein